MYYVQLAISYTVQVLSAISSVLDSFGECLLLNFSVLLDSSPSLFWFFFFLLLEYHNPIREKLNFSLQTKPPAKIPPFMTFFPWIKVYLAYSCFLRQIYLYGGCSCSNTVNSFFFQLQLFLKGEDLTFFQVSVNA